jgi:hypothetical protein
MLSTNFSLSQMMKAVPHGSFFSEYQLRIGVSPCSEPLEALLSSSTTLFRQRMEGKFQTYP